MRTSRNLLAVFAIIPLTALVVGSLLFYSSCTKQQLNDSSLTVDDHTIVEEAYNGMFLMVCEKGIPVYRSYTDSAFSVISVGDSVFTFTFDSSRIPEYDKAKHKGSLTISFAGNFRNAGSVATVTPGGDFYYSNYKISGVMTITNKGLDSDGKQYYEMQVTGANIITAAPNNLPYTWKCDRTLKIDDASALLFTQNIFTKGTASGIDHNKSPFVASIDDSLQRSITCRWPYNGNATITITGFATKSIAYGQADCHTASCTCINTAYIKTGNGKAIYTPMQ